jgi:hypothetical protein
MSFKKMNAATVNKMNRIEFGYESKLPSFPSFDSLKMRSERKRKNEKIRKEIFTFFNKSNNLGTNGAKVYSIVEYNGKFFIYNSCTDKEWPPLKLMLVRNVVIAIFLVKSRLTVSRSDIIQFQYGIPQTISVEKKNGERRDSE